MGQEVQQSTVSDYVPTLNDGIVFQHADMPNALDYTEPKVCKKSNKISKKALRKPAAKKAAPVAKRASASVAKKALPQAEKTSEKASSSSSKIAKRVPLRKESGWGFIALLLLATMMV